MEKLTKENCILGTRAVITDKKSKWNEETGAKDNGLICFKFNPEGTLYGDELELKPGSKITIQSKPRRFNDNGNQVKFTIDNDSAMYSAWWICIKSKVIVI